MSLTSNPNNKGTSEILQLSLNDSALDLLNAAIASHQENTNTIVNNNNSSSSESPETEKPNDLLHSKRELEKDAQTPTAPKRAGRKPLDKSQIPDASLDPKQKRKAQNRAAQRAFRDRKEKYVSELQARIEELEKLNATKDEDLLKENARLKEMLQKLQEENYALKGAKFTFEFPVTHPTTTATTATTQPPATHDLTNLPPSSDMNNFFSSYSEDASSSAEQSPSHTHEDDSTSSDTPITNNTMFSADPIQFGLIQPPNLSNDLDFLAVTGLNDTLTKNDSLPTADLFHGKDDLFSNYMPPTTTDDFLFTNGADLTNLFGATDDLFGNMNAQFGLPETPTTRRTTIPKEKRQQIIEKLKQAQQEGKHVYEGYQDLKQACPDFDLDVLCDELKQKAQCSVIGAYPLTEHDVNAFMKCMENK